MTAREALRIAELRLAAAGVPSPRVDAELLVAHLLGVKRSAVTISGSPLNASVSFPLSVLQSFTVRSSAPLATSLSSGENATERTALLCPFNDCATFPS